MIYACAIPERVVSMAIVIDGVTLEIGPEDTCIIDVAARAGIGIPSPCYRAERSDGCCQVCVVEIDGRQAYACCSAPIDGMRVVVDREDLKILRRERLREYASGETSSEPCVCANDGDCC
jgi:NADH-quinone oxidoreductase subunit G